MKANQYEEFDAALLSQIEAGRNTLSALDSKASGLQSLAVPHQKADRWGSPTPVFRVIDRRLQALRKNSLIRFNGKGWEKI